MILGFILMGLIMWVYARNDSPDDDMDISLWAAADQEAKSWESYQQDCDRARS